MILTWRTMVTCASFLCLAGPLVCAQDAINREYQLKAGYLWYFGHYVRWPEQGVEADPEKFVIGILGADPFGRHLEAIARSKTVSDKAIAIHSFKSIDEYVPCHILFVSRRAAGGGADTAQARLAAAAEKARGKPVLLVSESPGFARRGAIINFQVDTDANRLLLEINVKAAERARLTISSRLLALQRSGIVRIVEDE